MENLPVEYDAKDQVYDLLRLIEAEPPTFGAITEPQHYTGIGEILGKIKGWSKKIEEFRRSITRPIDDQKKQVMAFFEPYTQKLTNMEGNIKRVMIAYNDEQERQRREQQERLEAEKRRIAEAERAKAIEARAEALASGDKEEAQAAAEQQARAEELANMQVRVPEFITKVAGVGQLENWFAEVIDFKALPDEYKLPDEKKLGQLARRFHDSRPISGVRFYSKGNISVRAA